MKPRKLLFTRTSFHENTAEYSRAIQIKLAGKLFVKSNMGNNFKIMECKDLAKLFPVLLIIVSPIKSMRRPWSQKLIYIWQININNCSSSDSHPHEFPWASSVFLVYPWMSLRNSTLLFLTERSNGKKKLESDLCFSKETIYPENIGPNFLNALIEIFQAELSFANCKCPCF